MVVQRQPIKRPAIRSSRMLLLLAALSMILLTGCSRGSYPLDFFYEMHYAQSYKIQEPPSLSAPADSVPVTGRELDYALVQAQALENPVPAGPATIARGERLYQVNCAICHGATGLGDGPMRVRLEAAGYRSFPADLTSGGPTAGKADGEVFLIITKGFAGAYGLPVDAFVMPAFSKLLTEEDRWILVRYLRSLQQ